MYQQIPVQNQQMYANQYVIPVNPNPIVAQQYQNNPNLYINTGYTHITQNAQQIPNFGTDKRNSYNPFPQKGQVILTHNQKQRISPEKNNFRTNQRPGLYKTISPIPNYQPQTQGMIPNQQNPVPQQQNPIYPQIQQNAQLPVNPKLLKKTSLMTVNTLSNLPYSKFEKAEYSHQPFYNISGYAFNSYSGKVRGYNEDRTKTIMNYQKKVMIDGKIISPRISYFGVFDGHGGEACSNFLRDKLDSFIFNSKYFPGYPIQAFKEAFINAENAFSQQAIKNNSLVDKSGSCACVIIIINDTLYAVNLGDSRALLSSDNGQCLRQITRDHKPNDPIEKARIQKSGGQVYYANKVNLNGKVVVLKESDYGPGFTFPYRVNPGGLSVSFFL